MQNYLNRCLDSVLKNSYENIEVLLINDGSTDDSEKICNEYILNDSRFILINRENGGLSFARNVGLDHASGDYIMFLDSDDWLMPNAIDDLVLIINKTNAKIVEYRAKITKNKFEESSTNEYFLQNNLDALQRIFKNRHFGVWNRMVKKELLTQLRFVEGQIYEDILFTTTLLSKVQNIIYYDKFLYNYFFENNSSLVRGNYSLKQLDHIKSIEQTFSFAISENLDSKIIEAIKKHYENICVNNFISLTLHPNLDKNQSLKKEIKSKISTLKTKHQKNAKIISVLPIFLSSYYFVFRKKWF